ncbi:hypothetical protein SAMN05421790_110101 [Kroppenstedtia eburnea]|uniref:Uncharacterized protein n=1 Tax=Kroppenstedtia eburnea TaxID=714067 RepID=A0A1N7NX14_9BACL|nr:hypothetical protein SAMN05421790_110101 [Kroppenstedtia eburnea]
MGESKKMIKEIISILGWYLFLVILCNFVYRDRGLLNYFSPLVLVLAVRYYKNKLVVFLTKMAVLFVVIYFLFTLYYY